MRVTLTDSASDLAARADDLLRARIEHNVLATVLAIAQRRTGGGALFGFVEDGIGEVVGAALRLPPRRLLASQMDADAGVALLEAWLASDPDLPGVGGPRDVARSIAREWERRTGGRTELAMAQALHALERVVPPDRPAPGALRAATDADRDLLLEWMRDFLIGEGLHDEPTQMVDSRQMWIWEDAQPVSVLGNSQAVAGAVRIGPVYTPLEHRGRGYATSAVAAVSQVLLEEGAQQCILFTDLANPTSNKIYASVGYRRVVEWEELAFVSDPGA
jgi:predicted GNAT family acetyltransferase